MSIYEHERLLKSRAPAEQERLEDDIVDVLIPLAMHHHIYPEVWQAIHSQGILYRLKTYTTKQNSKNRLISICQGRNMLRQMSTAKFCFMIDSDVIIADNTFKDCINFLEANLKYAIVGIPYDKPYLLHDMDALVIHCGFMGLRGEVFRSVRFEVPEQGCECKAYCAAIRRKGWKLKYLTRHPMSHIVRDGRKPSRQNYQLVPPWLKKAR